MALTPRQKRLTYTVEEAARLLGVSPSHACEQIPISGWRGGPKHLAGVPVVEIGARLVIPRKALDTLLGIAGGDEDAATPSYGREGR